MSMSLTDGSVTKRRSSGKSFPSHADDERAPELLALEDMTLRENYKASEKLFEVRGPEEKRFFGRGRHGLFPVPFSRLHRSGASSCVSICLHYVEY